MFKSSEYLTYAMLSGLLWCYCTNPVVLLRWSYPGWTLSCLHLCPSGTLPSMFISLCLLCQMFRIVLSVSANSIKRARLTGKKAARVLGESTALRNLMLSTAVDARRSVCLTFCQISGRAAGPVFSDIWFLALQFNPTWLESFTCMWICTQHVHQGVTSKRKTIRRLIGDYKSTKRKGEDSETSMDMSSVSLSPGWNAGLLIRDKITNRHSVFPSCRQWHSLHLYRHTVLTHPTLS